MKDIMKDIYIPPEIYIPIFGVMIAEMMMISGKISFGFGIHVINLLIITIIVIIRDIEPKMKNVLYGIILIILLQMIDIATPTFYIAILQPVKYILMLIPILYIGKNLKIKRLLEENPKMFYISIFAISIMVMIVAGLRRNIGTVDLEITETAGKFIGIYLIFSIIITLLAYYTIYWNRYASKVVNMIFNSLLLMYIVIILSNILFTI